MRREDLLIRKGRNVAFGEGERDEKSAHTHKLAEDGKLICSEACEAEHIDLGVRKKWLLF